ncbi:MAG: protein kinase [Desulfomonile tiedjei]|nr:protein kinase [Desulfomonile tiedjei]
MNGAQADDSDIGRMWKEAEFYEAQGLYDHAVLVYQSILHREPDNRRAQAKVVQIQLTQRMMDTSLSRRSPGEVSPRMALDLGVAYMGMNLYAEALEEFKRALSSGPPVKVEALRYAAACLVNLRNYEEAQVILEKLIGNPALRAAEKADIIGEVVGIYIDQGAFDRARALFARLTDEQKEFIEGYEDIVSALAAGDLKKEVRPEQPGGREVVARQPAAEQVEEAHPEDSRVMSRELEQFIPLDTPVSYSLNNKAWFEGSCSKLSSNWALLHLSNPLDNGDNLIVRISLPTLSRDEQVWVISTVSQSLGQGRDKHRNSVRVKFVAFLPGGEALLKTFIDDVVKDPSILAGSVKKVSESHVQRSNVMFGDLEERAVRAMQEILLPESPEETERIREGRRAETHATGDLESQTKSEKERVPGIRFACECGQVHVVPMKFVGRKGQCAACGRAVTVPVVDARPDVLADQMIGKSVGGCRLLYKIGGGGMGGVFKGHHLGLDLPVAVKILHSHLAEKDPVFIKRFIREARAAAKLQHPNIVGVLNVGNEDGLHYIVMPFVEGGNAAALLAKVGNLPVEKVLNIAIDITKALGVAEEHNMLHRDIKPANILFTGKGESKLADLGLAKNFLESQDPGITQTGIACGTPLYFSPEQAKGSKKLDIRSDIYSLGITLYHLLDGSPPFKGESAYVIFQKHVHEPLPPFETVDSGVPEPVFQLLQKMTEKKADNRFKDSAELLDALLALKREVVGSRKPTVLKKGLLERLGIRKPK